MRSSSIDNIYQSYNQISNNKVSIDPTIMSDGLKINISNYENRKKERKERRNKFIENRKHHEKNKTYKEYHKKIDTSSLCNECKSKILYTCSNNYYCICNQSKTHYDDIVYIGQPIQLNDSINNKASAPILYGSIENNKYANTPRQQQVVRNLYHNPNNDNHNKCCIIF